MRILIILLLIACSGNTLFAQLDSLKVRDTRNVISNPSHYSKIFIPQLKYYLASGLPEVGTKFATVFGFRAWGTDNSGGKAHELGFADDSQMYLRSGSSTTWESWKRILQENNGKVGIGTLDPKTSLDIDSNLRLGTFAEMPAEGSILEGVFGNYILGNINGGQKLKLGVANDFYTKAEIFLDNNNRPDGTISFKTGTGNMASATRMFIDGNGNVSIGTNDAKGYRFAVNGDAMFTKIKVKTFSAWPDYVFDFNYQLRPLHEVEEFIKTNKHLPDVPAAVDVENEGIDVAATQAILLKKIEELTLYLIEQNKQIKTQEKLIIEQQAAIEKLKNLQ